MSNTVLAAQKREATGKGPNRVLRRKERVPGVYYFHGEDPVPLSVDDKELRSAIHSDANLIDLDVPGKKKSTCVIREIQWDPIKGHPLHVDFMGIDLKEKVTVSIPIHLIGPSEGEKLGGILQHVLREISIECLPGDIPDNLEIDITSLQIGEGISVGDLSLEKVRILHDESQAIAIVRQPSLVTEEVEEEVEDEEAEQAEQESEEGDDAE